MDKKRKIFRNLWIVLLLYIVIGLVFDFRIGFVALICMFTPPFTAPFFGRKWCGTFCPRGSFLDRIIAKISLKKDIPNFMLTPFFRWSIFSLLMGFFTFQMFKAWGNWSAMGLLILTMVLVTTIIAVIVGIIYKPRTWCTAFCPMGTLATALNNTKGSIIFQEGCVSCQLCSKACPMQLEPAKYKGEGRVTDSRCIGCNKCTISCPKKILVAEVDKYRLNEEYVG